MTLGTYAAGKVLSKSENGYFLYLLILSVAACLGILVVLFLICDDRINRDGSLTTLQTPKQEFEEELVARLSIQNKDQKELPITENRSESQRFSRTESMKYSRGTT